jgi:NAD(P)-dependent dehydrogenase (short-subunit alcohol dehydrogenase family)
MRIDALVLNTGILKLMCRIGSMEMSLAQWKSHFKRQLSLACDHVASILAGVATRGGRVIFVSSGAVYKATPGCGPYNASKAVMNSLGRYGSSILPLLCF